MNRTPALRSAVTDTESAKTSNSRRLALYSHDTQGLGHVRRNSVVAAALVAKHPDTDVLLLTGAPEATALPLPPRTEVITVPSLHKNRAGDYSARKFSARSRTCWRCGPASSRQH